MVKDAEQVPLKELLRSIDIKDGGFYGSLTEKQKKAFSPWVAMRYASSAAKHSEYYLLMVNELVNCNFNVIAKHPELAWRLISACGCGSPVFHPWVPVPTKKKSQSGITQVLSDLNPTWNKQELELFLKLNTKKELEEYFSGFGFPSKEIKELVK